MASRFLHLAPWLVAPLALGAVILLWTSLTGPAALPQAAAGVADHVEAATGLCHAIGFAYDDREASAAAFTNEAHLALHALASDSRLKAPLAAALLEAKYTVEADFAAGASGQPLHDDLVALYQATVAALGGIGADVPACDAP